MKGTIIVATDENWLIGDRPDPAKNGRTPWQGKLPADMQYFQDQTVHKKLLFTRPTYLTIPKKFRPLRDRDVAVITRDPDFTEDGISVFHDLDTAFHWAGDDELMICGGGELYQQALLRPGVNRVLRTVVNAEFDGNVYFPKLESPEWKLVASSSHQADGVNEYGYCFEEYRWGVMSANDIEVKPYPERIVDPRNARTRAYLLELLRLQRQGQCPFCPGGKTLLEDPIEEQNDLCWLKVSHTPVRGTALHLVIAPVRHVLSREELTSSERDAMDEMIYRYLRNNNLRPGGGHWTREGPTEETGATVCHLHENYYINKVVDGSPELVTIHCGRWTGEPGWLTQ